MDEQPSGTQTPSAPEWPVGLIVGFSAVFLVGFALIAAVVLSRRKQG